MRLPMLDGPRVRLRPLRRTDIPALAAGANDRDIARFMPSIAHPYTEDHARRWVNYTQRAARDDAAYQFGIERVHDGSIIGMMGLKNLNWNDKNGELEYWLARSFRGRGHAGRAMHLLLSFAFKERQIHRVYAITVAHNIKSWKLLEQYGFVRESVMREACRMGNKWRDVYAYGLLAREFRQAGS